MAQTTPFTWYGDNAPGIPGMVANSTVKTIRSYAAQTGFNAGALLIAGTDPEGQVTPATAASQKPVGVAAYEPDGNVINEYYYPQGATVPVLTYGDIWVAAGGAITAGTAVGYDIANGFITATETTPSGNVYLTTAAQKGDMVMVHIANPEAIVVSNTAG